jgi:hypothetical protein
MASMFVGIFTVLIVGAAGLGDACDAGGCLHPLVCVRGECTNSCRSADDCLSGRMCLTFDASEGLRSQYCSLLPALTTPPQSCRASRDCGSGYDCRANACVALCDHGGCADGKCVLPPDTGRFTCLYPVPPGAIFFDDPEASFPTTERATWKKGGWDVYRWGMGPRDFIAAARMSAGIASLRKNEISSELAGLASFAVDHMKLRVSGETLRLVSADFYNNRLCAVGLHVESEVDSNDTRRTQFASFAHLLEGKYGKPTSMSMPGRVIGALPPFGSNWYAAWNTAGVSIILVAAQAEPGGDVAISLTYSDPVVDAKVSAARRAKDTHKL